MFCTDINKALNIEKLYSYANNNPTSQLLVIRRIRTDSKHVFRATFQRRKQFIISKYVAGVRNTS